MRTLAIAHGVWIAALLAVLVVDWRALWVLDYHAWPAPGAVATIAAYLVIVALPAPRSRTLHNALLAAVLALYGFASFVQPLGDYGLWHEQATWSVAGISEPLANATFRLVYLIAGHDAMQLVAPSCGLLFHFLLLTVADRLCTRPDDPHPKRTKQLCDVACLAGPWSLLFTTNFIEQTQLGLPLLLLALLPMCAYTDSARPRRTMLGAAALLGLSATVHGQAFALAPALPLLAWLGRRDRPGREKRIDAALALSLVAAIYGVTLATLWLFGFYLSTGNVYGLLFVPLTPSSVSAQTLLNSAHFTTVANIAILASPLVAAAPLVAFSPTVRQRWLGNATAKPALLLAALGYCGFTFVILFILGFPRDVDLMLGLGVVHHLFLLRTLCASDGARSPMVWLTVAIGGALIWTVGASLRVDRPPAGVSLLVNGRTGVVDVRPGERAVVQVRGRGRFRVLRHDTDSHDELLHEGNAPWASRPMKWIPSEGATRIEVRWNDRDATETVIVQAAPRR